LGTGTRAMAYFYKIYSSTHLNYLTLLIYIELAVAFETRVQRYTVSATSQRQLCITFLMAMSALNVEKSFLSNELEHQ